MSDTSFLKESTNFLCLIIDFVPRYCVNLVIEYCIFTKHDSILSYLGKVSKNVTYLPN